MRRLVSVQLDASVEVIAIVQRLVNIVILSAIVSKFGDIMDRLVINGNVHEVGNTRCNECWGKGYPMKCSCGGLIHAQFVKENWKNETQLEYSCDVCGGNYHFPRKVAPKKPKFQYRRKRNNHT